MNAHRTNPPVSRHLAWSLPSWLALTLAGCGNGQPSEPGAASPLIHALRADSAGFLPASPSYELSFPRDHAPHPGFRTEWWYFTGNLSTKDPEAREFGFQLTFFRSGLVPQPTERSSPLASSEAWMAHFALTDFAGNRTHHAERFARGAPGFAGPLSAKNPADLGVGDWQIQALENLGKEKTPSFRLIASEPDFSIDLLLTSTKRLVPQGRNGYSRKGSGESQASHYVSATRMSASGTVGLGPGTQQVEGSAWLDREWTSSLLGEDQLGWDWFSIQLDDGTDLMAYRMRLADGGIDPTAHGSLTRADGRSRNLSANEYKIVDTGAWTSPQTGVRYPADWTLSVPSQELELVLEVPVDDCEIGTTYRYWEGPIRVRGTRAGGQVSGVGYAELVGYGGSTVISGSTAGTLTK